MAVNPTKDLCFVPNRRKTSRLQAILMRHWRSTDNGAKYLKA